MMCLLGVSMMNNHIQGSKGPQNPHFWAWIGILSQICEKIQIAISLDLCITLTWNLTSSCGQQQRLHELSRKVVKLFQDGGRPPFWKSIYRHISVKNHPIFMKFCIEQQILNWVNVTWSKMKKLHWTDSEFDRTYFLFQIKMNSLNSLIYMDHLSTSSRTGVRPVQTSKNSSVFGPHCI